MNDFSLSAYEHLLRTFDNCGYRIYGVQQWLREAPEKGVLMRHDVDRRPQNALIMAELEHYLGISTTYYFRADPCSFHPQIITKIKNMGHEIGYHYEDLSTAKGDYALAKNLFSKNLKRFRELAPVTTAAMHGAPLSKINNLDFWQQFSLLDFNLNAEAFLTIDYSGTYYFSDAGRAWDANRTNFRDRPKSSRIPNLTVHDTKQLIDFIIQYQPNQLAFSLHPERWDSTRLGWIYQKSKDEGINLIKLILSLFRGKNE